MPILLPHSMFYLSLLSCLALVLTIRIVKVRMKLNIGIGDGKNEYLTRQMRVQANFLENFLPFAILFILIESSNASNIVLHIVGSAFLVARLLHAYGLSQSSGRTFGRYYGTLLSWISLMSLIAINLYHSILYFI